MAEYHAAMDKLQLLNERVDILEVRERQLKSVIAAGDSSVTNLQQALTAEIRAGELCESDLEAVGKKLRQEKTQKTILAGITVALIGAVLYLAISD